MLYPLQRQRLVNVEQHMDHLLTASLKQANPKGMDVPSPYFKIIIINLTTLK